MQLAREAFARNLRCQQHYLLDWLKNNVNFDYFQVDVILPAASPTLPNKAYRSKYVMCQNKVEKMLSYVKTEGSGLNTILEIRIQL